MREPSPYAGETVVFATMHGKERLAQPAFAERLGAAVVAPELLDTDRFGAFAGDVPRTLSPRAAAVTKARLGLELTGAQLGLASEGTFSSVLGLGVENREVLVFIDDARGLELVEFSTQSSPLPPSRNIRTVADAADYARAIGFPRQGVIIRAELGSNVLTHKNMTTEAALIDAVERGLVDGMSVAILPDYRAHRSPSRAEHIRSLCERMAARLATPCPNCSAPGFGLVDVERGLPCSLCGSLTDTIAAYVRGCGACDYRERRPGEFTAADPSLCDWCNP
ncbi:MAG: DUF6671 family protein [Rhodoglobus sp.]